MSGFKSCLYEVQVMHHRTRPVKNRFSYRYFMCMIDLDELEKLSRGLWLLGINRLNLFSLLKKDHYHTTNGQSDSIKNQLNHYLISKGREPASRIQLLTNLRTAGYQFNPVSFYYCYNGENECTCAVTEVGNTFGEMKMYLLAHHQAEDKSIGLQEEKFFYVSPFISSGASFRFNLEIPEEQVNIQIDTIENDQVVLYANLRGKRKPLTDFNLLRYFLRFPFVTLQVIGLIHWQAVRLWFKRVPYFRKKQESALQKDYKIIHQFS